MRCFSENKMRVLGKMEYRIFKEIIIEKGGVTYSTYGIEIIKSGKAERRISDVSCSYSKVKELCSLCNQLEVSSLHIDDVIEDFLCDEP